MYLGPALRLVAENGLALLYVAEALRENREVVIAAVRQNGVRSCLRRPLLKGNASIIT